MSYEYFGILLRELRESRNLTREQLSDNICSPKQIYRIEKGEYEPSLYLLNQLSIKLNMDLNEYFKMYFSNQSISGFEGIKQLNNAVEQGNLNLIQSLVQKYEKLDEFKRGENLEHVLYGKALCSALIDKDYTSSLMYCMKGIHVENPKFTIDCISKSIYSNVGLSIINCIGLNYLAMNERLTGLKVFFDLLYVIENYILDSPFPMYQGTQFSKKIYENTLYNLSLHLLKSGDDKQALHYVDKGIDFAVKEYNLRFLPELQYMKFKLLYNAQKYEEAKEYHQRIISLYKITNQKAKLKEYEDLVITEYPMIM